MERCLTEEQITKATLTWLESNDWEIICYDFPQSGSGISLHPNDDFRSSKNKESIIPDIVAFKNKTVVLLENKNRFYLNDFLKLQHLKNTTDYSHSIGALLSNYDYTKIYYGVALPDNTKTQLNIKNNLDKIDFAILVDNNLTTNIFYSNENIF